MDLNHETDPAENRRRIKADPNFQSLSFDHPRALRMKEDLAELIAERGFDSIEGFVYGLLWEDRALKRRERLADIGRRMWNEDEQ